MLLDKLSMLQTPAGEIQFYNFCAQNDRSSFRIIRLQICYSCKIAFNTMCLSRTIAIWESMPNSGSPYNRKKVLSIDLSLFKYCFRVRQDIDLLSCFLGKV